MNYRTYQLLETAVVLYHNFVLRKIFRVLHSYIRLFSGLLLVLVGFKNTRFCLYTCSFKFHPERHLVITENRQAIR